MFARQARRTSLRRLLGLSLAAALTLALTAPDFSPASFTGQNGKVFYEQESDIWSINADGTGALDLTPEEGFSGQRPSGSADGRHVVFQTFRDGGWNIFSMNADGSNQVDLTNTKDPVINFEPAFSPDGSKVAFMRQGLTAGEEDIWVINANGSGAVDLTNSPGINETAPEFSPDGTKIVYISSGPTLCCGAEYNNDIWVMNANGSSPEQLTETNFPIQNVGPTWSPDSAKIAYSTLESSTAGDNGLHVMNADGTGKTALLNEGNPIHSDQLSWSPDGTRIAYEASTGNFVSTVEVAGGALTPLVSDSAHYPSWVPAPVSNGEGGPPALPSPGGSAGVPPVVAPAAVLPSKKPLKCGQRQEEEDRQRQGEVRQKAQA